MIKYKKYERKIEVLLSGGEVLMGTYLNPGNYGFSGIRNDTYVDKSGLVHLITAKHSTKAPLRSLQPSSHPG